MKGVIFTRLFSPKAADRPDAADKLEEHEAAMAGFRSRHGDVNFDLYAAADRFKYGQVGEHRYIFELGRVYERSNATTKEHIDSLLSHDRPLMPAERPPGWV